MTFLKHLFVMLSVAVLPSVIALGNDGPQFSFISKRIAKYENIQAGEIVVRNVVFKNTGDEPLIISEVGKTCTCTSVDYPKDAVLPGKEGTIILKIDTTGKNGLDIIVVTILANDSQKKHVIRVDLDVIPEE